MLELLLLARLGAFHCNPAELPDDVAAGFAEIVVEGVYQNTFEQSVLKSCADAKRVYWVNSEPLRDLFNEHYDVLVESKSQLYVKVKARVSPEGQFGHLGRYRFCLTDVSVASYKIVPNEAAWKLRCGRRR